MLIRHDQGAGATISAVVRTITGAALAVLICLAPQHALAHSDPSQDGLIDGGGNAKTDCVSKFQTGLELNYPVAPKKSKELRCTDGDLACDSDGAVNGSCTIEVGLCLADDEDMPLCTPAGVPPGGVEVIKKPVGHPRYDAALQTLQDEVDLMLGASGVPCDTPGPENCLRCTDATVPVTASLASKSGKKKIKLKVTTEPAPPKNKPIKDVDKLKLRCVECETASTFEHIADVVFKTGCAASQVCHSGGAGAGGLNLDIGEIGAAALYDELLTEAPSAVGASPLSMARIFAGDPGLGTAGSASLLYEKLLRTNGELDQLCTSGGQAAGCLGQSMPPSTDEFSTGKLELLKTWIEAGAPIDTWVPGATCGEPEDTWAPADPPAPPAAGEGFQAHMPQPDGFVLEPGEEFEGCWWLPIPATVTETWYINRIEIVANTGTHHIILFDDVPDSGPPAEPTAFDPTDAACGRKFGVKAMRIVTQDPTFEQTLPANTAYVIEPGEIIGFNPHYVNNFNVDIYPEVWLNFYGSTTPSLAEAEFAIPGDVGFSIPPGQIGLGNLATHDNNSGTGQCFFSLTTHQHRRGTGMKIWSSEPSSWNDGTDLLMYSTDWDHPGWLQPAPRLLVAPGESLWMQCEWDNGALADPTMRCQQSVEGPGPGQCGLTSDYVCFSDDDCPIGPTTGLCRECNLDFGLLAEDEMCFMLSYYYDAQPGPDPCPW